MPRNGAKINEKVAFFGAFLPKKCDKKWIKIVKR